MKVRELRELLEQCMDDSDIGIVTESGIIADFRYDRFVHQHGSFLLFPLKGAELDDKIMNRMYAEWTRIRERITKANENSLRERIMKENESKSS